jgi:hypothetical protein
MEAPTDPARELRSGAELVQAAVAGLSKMTDDELAAMDRAEWVAIIDIHGEINAAMNSLRQVMNRGERARAR